LTQNIPFFEAAKSGRFHILAVMDPQNMPMLTEQLTYGFKHLGGVRGQETPER